MKIGICVSAVQLDGATRTAFMFADACAAPGFSVTLLSPQTARTALPLLRRGTGYIDLRRRWWESEIDLRLRLRRRLVREDFDLLFIMTGLPIPQLEQALHGLPTKTALVPVALGNSEHVYGPITRGRALWNVALTISPALQTELSRRVPDRPIRLIPHGIDLPEPVAVDSRAAAAPGGPLRLLFVGRLVGLKNVMLLPKILQACVARQLRVSLTIVGGGPDHAALVRGFAAAGLTALVDFRPEEAHPGLYEVYRSHHLLLFPSKPGEGLGLVVLEAQATGCVPVASRLEGVTDYSVRDGVTGRLAAVDDAADFADQIVRLADRSEWLRMSEAGIGHVADRFSLQRFSEALLALVADISAQAYPVERPGPPASRAEEAPGDRLPLILRKGPGKLRKLAKQLMRSAVGKNRRN